MHLPGGLQCALWLPYCVQVGSSSTCKAGTVSWHACCVAVAESCLSSQYVQPQARLCGRALRPGLHLLRTGERPALKGRVWEGAMLAATTCAGLQWQAASCLTSLPSSTPQPKGSSALHTAAFTSPCCWLPQGDVENAKKCFKNAIKCSPQHLEVGGWRGSRAGLGWAGSRLIDRSCAAHLFACLPTVRRFLMQRWCLRGSGLLPCIPHRRTSTWAICTASAPSLAAPSRGAPGWLVGWL